MFLQFLQFIRKTTDNSETTSPLQQQNTPLPLYKNINIDPIILSSDPIPYRFPPVYKLSKILET
jgi:hypothetical protein